LINADQHLRHIITDPRTVETVAMSRAADLHPAARLSASGPRPLFGTRSRSAKGCPGKFSYKDYNQRSFCADLIRASTPLFRALEDVDGRDIPSQDETRGPISSLIRLSAVGLAGAVALGWATDRRNR
jgi:hypothetical protein